MALREENKRRDKYLRKKYNLSLKDYNKMLKVQNDSCAICKKHKSHFTRSLHVDHDHKTGKNRGLLCFRCNKLYVGFHTLDTARAVVKYLENFVS